METFEMTIVYETESRCWRLACQHSNRRAYLYRLDHLPECLQSACTQAVTQPERVVVIALPHTTYQWLFRS